jgi:hypothetical protein
MTILTVGIDLAKKVLGVHGVNEAGKAELIRPAVPRDKLHELVASLEDLPGYANTVVGDLLCEVISEARIRRGPRRPRPRRGPARVPKAAAGLSPANTPPGRSAPADAPPTAASAAADGVTAGTPRKCHWALLQTRPAR